MFIRLFCMNNLIFVCLGRPCTLLCVSNVSFLSVIFANTGFDPLLLGGESILGLSSSGICFPRGHRDARFIFIWLILRSILSLELGEDYDSSRPYLVVIMIRLSATWLG